MHGKTDTELMELVMSKHRPALEELYERYVKLVYSFAHKATKSEPSTREVVQMVFTRLWTTKAGYDPSKGQFVSWLLTVTRHAATDLLRRERKQTLSWTETAAHLEELPGSPDDEPEAALLRTATREEIQRAYAALSEKQARLLDQVYWQGYTLSEAAQVTGEPIGTVKNRLHQSLKVLRRLLQDQREG